jgi:LacI family transcriptional regulator
VVSSTFDTATGQEAAEKLLAFNPPPAAIFAVNDFTAIGVTGALRIEDCGSA